MAWCKTRAMEYLNAGRTQEAFNSMASDLNKHPETENHIGMILGCQMLLGGFLESPIAMRKFIEGFN